MKAYQNKDTGLWKWGKRGEYVHETRDAAYETGMIEFQEAMRRMRERQHKIGQNHGRGI